MHKSVMRIHETQLPSITRFPESMIESYFVVGAIFPLDSYCILRALVWAVPSGRGVVLNERQRK